MVNDACKIIKFFIQSTYMYYICKQFLSEDVITKHVPGQDGSSEKDTYFQAWPHEGFCGTHMIEGKN